MNRNNIIWLVFVALAFFVACNKTDYLNFDGNYLKFNAKLSLEDDTRAVDEDYVSIYGDTIFSPDDKDVYLTSETNNIGSGSETTRGVPLDSELKIPSLKVYVFNTGTSTWASGQNRTLESELSMPNSSDGNFDYMPLIPFTKDVNNRSFIAYSPIESPTNGVVKQASGTLLNYTVPSDVTRHPDICTSQLSGNTDVKNIGGGEHIRDFALKHELTAIGFALRGSGVKIISATITGVKTAGTLNLDTKVWSLGGTADARAAKIKQQFYNVAWTDSWVDCTEPNGYLMMIPQTLTDDAKLTIVYQYNYGENNGKNLTLVSNLRKLTGGVWTAGKRISYNIRLKANPSVTAGDLLIDCSLAGFTTKSTINTANVASDDVLTFTWDASWLKIHQGSPKENNTSGGATSGWSVAANKPLNNLYFFATTNNPSTMTRTATVTVRGKKSLERTFKVTQIAKPTLSVSPSSFEVGYEYRYDIHLTLDVKTNSYYHDISAKSDKSWLKVSTTSFFSVMFEPVEWNINPGKRVANVKIQVLEKNIPANEVIVTVTQQGSGSFVVLSEPNLALSEYNTVRSWVDAQDGGDYAVGTFDIPKHCGHDKTLPSEVLWRTIIDQYVKTGKWENKGNLRANRWYWTNEYNCGKWGWYGKDIYMDLNNNNNYWFTKDHFESDAKTYRCVYNNPNPY